MKTGLIDFHFAYVQLLVVNKQEAIVFDLFASVRRDLDRVLSSKGALINLNAAGT